MNPLYGKGGQKIHWRTTWVYTKLVLLQSKVGNMFFLFLFSTNFEMRLIIISKTSKSVTHNSTTLRKNAIKHNILHVHFIQTMQFYFKSKEKKHKKKSVPNLSIWTWKSVSCLWAHSFRISHKSHAFLFSCRVFVYFFSLWSRFWFPIHWFELKCVGRNAIVSDRWIWQSVNTAVTINFDSFRG